MTEDVERPNGAPAPLTPYVGLVPYDEGDAAFFFGRDDERRIVSGNLRASGLTLLYGTSGVGKTSLLRAGVVHHLRREMLDSAPAERGRAPFAVCTFAAWRDDPLPALMVTIRAAAVEAVGDGDLPGWSPGDPVEVTLRSWTERVRTLLVILDQFEDFFLYHPDERGEDTFAGEFPAIVNDPNLRVHFLVSIREDSLAKLDRFKGEIPRLFANYVRIEHLGRAAALAAIELPIREWNRRSPDAPPYTLEPGVADAVIGAAETGRLALGRDAAEPGASLADRQGVEAPFLQLVMERLWRATVEAGSHDLTLSRLEALGGPERIVENHLLEALGTLVPAERAVAADLFRFLVTRSRTKIAHPISDLVEWTGRPEPVVSDVLDKLCRGEGGRILRRLPPPPAGNGDARYELFHDVLAEPILEWRRDYEQEQRRKETVRRFVRVGGALLSVAGVFAALGIWALVQRSEAQSATRSATSLALASAASGGVPDHVEQSLLLALEALRTDDTAEASSAMVEALETARSSGAQAILRGDSEGVRTIAYSPDGRTLASADFDGTIRLWDTKGRTTLGEPLRGHTNEVWGLSFSPDGETLASSSFDGTLRLWDVRRQLPLGPPIDADVGAVRSVAFGLDGRTVAFAGSDDTVRLWDVRGSAVGAPLQGHRSSVMSIAFSPDGETLASGGSDRTVRLWDVQTGRQREAALEGHTDKVVSVAFSPDGRSLASSDLAGRVRLWDVATHELLREPVHGETGQVWGVAFSPDGRILASSGFDGTVRLWSVKSGRAVAEPLRGHSRGVIGVAFASDGTLASASYDGTVRLWDLSQTGSLGEPIGTHDGRVTTLSFSSDGGMLASGGFDRTIRLWDLRARRPLSELRSSRIDSVESVAFAPDGHTLAAADVGGSIWLWELPGRDLVGRLQHETAASTVAFRPDGRMLASGDDDGLIRFWDPASRDQIGEPLAAHDGSVLGLAYSSDGRTLVTSGSDGSVRLWDIAERRPTGRLPLDEGEVVAAVAFGPDGRTLATGSVGGAVRLWDARTRQPVSEPMDDHAPYDVESVMFSADGRILASASGDGTLRLWDVRGLRPLGRPLRGHDGAVFAVAVSPDRRSIASGGDDGTVRLWERILWRDLADLEAQVCRLVVPDLTEAEWQELVPGLPYRRTCTR